MTGLKQSATGSKASRWFGYIAVKQPPLFGDTFIYQTQRIHSGSQSGKTKFAPRTSSSLDAGL